MKKFIFIKNKVLYSADDLLENNFGDNFQPIVLTLPAIPCLTHIINLLVVSYIEYFYKNRGIKKLIYEYCDNGGNSHWILDYNEYKKLGERILTDRIFVNKAIKDFKKSSKRYYHEINKLEKNGIDDKNFPQEFLKLVELYIAEFAVNYSMTGPITFGYGDIAAKQILEKYNNSKQIKEAVNTLTKPAKNFLSQEQEDLEEISRSARKAKIKITTLPKLKINAPCVYKKLMNHRKKYYWISNNYKNTKYLELGYFFNSLKFPKNNKISKDRKINFNKIKKRDINILKLLGKMARLQDERKKANMIANYWLMEYVKKISKRAGISFSILKFASLWELMDLLNNKKIAVEKIIKRKEGCMLVNISNKNEYWLTGREYKKFKKKIDFYVNKNFDKNIISGAIAYYGKVKGNAKIILNIKKDGKKLNRGDILVTSMTRPEFMPLAKKAGAIITDEGGITSHAAIISRELKIPCIVGVKNATKVLRDGDLVEVDANNGIIKLM